MATMLFCDRMSESRFGHTATTESGRCDAKPPESELDNVDDSLPQVDAERQYVHSYSITQTKSQLKIDIV